MRSFPRHLPRVLLYAAAIATIFSCGGGGASSAGKLVYETDWSNRGRSVTGLSQKVQLFDSSGRLSDEDIVNQDAQGLMFKDLTATGGGPYHLHVELYSLRDLAGTKTGELDSWVSISGSAHFRTLVGLDATNILVTPQQATIQVQHSRQFYATAYAVANRAVFVEPDSFDWSTLGGTASVSEDGLVLGLSEGPGTVRANYVPGSLLGSATFQVAPFQTTQTRWTIMIFLNAENDLAPFSTLNVNQMETVAGNDQVRFVIQWKTHQTWFGSTTAPFEGTRRYLVRQDTTDSIASEVIQDLGEGVDMGLPATLLDFVNWTKTYYPADRYCLVIWNHGNGWHRGVPEGRAVSYDDETGHAIQIWELNQALGSNLFDIVAWDASLMQMLEVAYEIQDRAKYVVGSEESPPGEGYPYDLVFQKFRDQDTDTTASLTKAFVDGMLAVPEYASRKITQSVIDTTKLPALGASVNALGTELINNVGSLGTVIPQIRASTQSYSESSTRHYRDLDHLCNNIFSNVSIPSIQNAAADVRTKLADALVWEGHNSNSPNSRGLSIDFSKSTDFLQGTNSIDYALMRFAADTSWNEWLQIAP